MNNFIIMEKNTKSVHEEEYKSINIFSVFNGKLLNVKKLNEKKDDDSDIHSDIHSFDKFKYIVDDSFRYKDNLSPEQEKAFLLFKEGKNIFITGAGGTGKTKLINIFNKYIENTYFSGKYQEDTTSIKQCSITKCGNRKNIQICALTGCATLLLKCGAKTLHSWSGIKLAKGPSDKIILNVLKNKKCVSNWKKTHILIIDEVSMLSMKIFEIIEIIGRNIKKCNLPFGGIQVVFLGDFFQLPPVSSLDEPDSEKFCFESSKWFDVFPIENHIELKTMFRQKDPEYISILKEIRIGNISEKSVEILNKYVGRKKPEDIIPTKLFPVNVKANFVNQEMYSNINNKDEYIYECDIVENCEMYIDTGTDFSVEVKKKCKSISLEEKERETNSIINNMPCPKILSLKIGCIVMCRCNLDMDNGICNGSQGIVISFTEEKENIYPVVRFENGAVKLIKYKSWQSEDYPCIAIYQIPLILSWAQTIHKMQGATLSSAEIDVGETVFEYGQAYVAFSRLKSLDGLYLLSFSPKKIKANPKVIEFYEKNFL